MMTEDTRQLVSILLPAYNEEAILENNLAKVIDYLREHGGYRWEIVIINDGSSDRTAEIADGCAARYDEVSVVHHRTNRGLGGATKTGIAAAAGDYLIVLDIDLSYDVAHIGRLLDKLESSGADVILASPYMKGGTIRNVPRLRRILSIAANRFLAIVAHGRLSTLTCMVRGYRGDFARALTLRSTGMDVMPETVYKTMILRGRIEQIPADLDWGDQLKNQERKSSMRIFRQILGTLLSGFLFRPFMFFIVPGALLLLFSIWVNTWMIVHFFDALAVAPDGAVADTVSWAVSTAYQQYPHTFIVGLLSLMLSIQLLSLGILALQTKSYFEEIFYLGSSLRDVDRPGPGPTGSQSGL